MPQQPGEVSNVQQGSGWRLQLWQLLLFEFVLIISLPLSGAGLGRWFARTAWRVRNPEPLVEISNPDYENWISGSETAAKDGGNFGAWVGVGLVILILQMIPKLILPRGIGVGWRVFAAAMGLFFFAGSVLNLLKDKPDYGAAVCGLSLSFIAAYWGAFKGRNPNVKGKFGVYVAHDTPD
jgi:hypothetical protein